MNTVRFIRGLGSFNLHKGPVSLAIADYGCRNPKIEIKQGNDKPLSMRFDKYEHHLMLNLLSDDHMIKDLEKFNEDCMNKFKNDCMNKFKEDFTSLNIDEIYQKKFGSNDSVKQKWSFVDYLGPGLFVIVLSGCGFMAMTT